MNYALIENDIVVNIIVLYEGNAHEFPNAVNTGEIPVQIGDTYTDGVFYRNGEIVLSNTDQANQLIAEMDAAIVELTYQNILYENGGVNRALPNPCAHDCAGFHRRAARQARHFLCRGTADGNGVYDIIDHARR